MALSRREISKDAIQQAAEAAIGSLGRVTAIVFGATRDVTTEIGSFATEIFEIREASRRADADESLITGPRPPADQTNPPA